MEEVKTLDSYLRGRSQKVTVESREHGVVAKSCVARGVGVDLFSSDLLAGFPGIWLEVTTEASIESADFDPYSESFDVFIATALGAEVGTELTPFQEKLIDYLAQTADFLEFKLGRGSDEF